MRTINKNLIYSPIELVLMDLCQEALELNCYAARESKLKLESGDDERYITQKSEAFMDLSRKLCTLLNIDVLGETAFALLRGKQIEEERNYIAQSEQAEWSYRDRTSYTNN